MSYYESTVDEEAKQTTFRCIILAAIVVFGGLCAMIYGFAWLNHTEITTEDIHARRRMDKEIAVLQNQIEDLYQWRTAMVFEYGNHTHRYSDGKIK